MKKNITCLALVVALLTAPVCGIAEENSEAADVIGAATQEATPTDIVEAPAEEEQAPAEEPEASVEAAVEIEEESENASPFVIDGGTLTRYTGSEPSVMIPEGVRVIGGGAFRGNTSLVHVRLSSTVESINAEAFKGCVNLEQVTGVNPEVLKSIGANAFANCVKLNASFGNKIENVAASAFAGCTIGVEKAPAEDEPAAEAPAEDETMVDVPETDESDEEEAVADEPVTEEPAVDEAVENQPVDGQENEKQVAVSTPANESPATEDEVVVQERTEVSQCVITKQPSNAQAALNEVAYFSVEATGAVSYQWQMKAAGSDEWTNLSRTTASMSLRLTTEERLNALYRCVLTDENGIAVTTNEVQVISGENAEPETPSESTAIVITRQPVNTTGALNDIVYFSVEATGAVSYQWQLKTPGSTEWMNLSRTTASMSVRLNSEDRVNAAYRCVLTDANGNTLATNEVGVLSEAVDTPSTAIAITKQPEDVVGELNDVVFFSVEATGAVSYQWQIKESGGDEWANLSRTTASMSLRLTTEARVNASYRCVLTDASGSTLISGEAKVISEVVIMPSETIKITKQPTDAEGVLNDVVMFSVEAAGAESYQWQIKLPGSDEWTNLSRTTASMSIRLNSDDRVNASYRCVLTDADGNTAATDEVKVVTEKVETPSGTIVITKQPVNVEGAINDVVGFSVEATGAVSYQWQIKLPGSDEWTNLSRTTAAMTVRLNSEDRVQASYRCVLTDAHGDTLTTNEAKVLSDASSTPSTQIVITAQPVDIQAELNDVAYFSVKATGAASYQWQMKLAGSDEWTNLSRTTASMSIRLNSEDRVQASYRCVLTDADGYMLTTNEVKITEPAIVIDGVTYKEVDGGITVYSYSGSASSLTISETVEGLTVISISASAFESNTTLTSIDLPDTIQVIGTNAFKNCSALAVIN